MTTVAEIEERIESGETVTVGEFLDAAIGELVDGLSEIEKILADAIHDIVHFKFRPMPTVTLVCKSVYHFKPLSVRRRLYAYLNMGVGY